MHDYSGGIVGASTNTIDDVEHLTVSNCYSTGTIGTAGSGSCNGAGGIIGGYVGIAGTCDVSNCYSTGDIGTNSSTDQHCGGIVGSIFGSAGIAGSTCSISNCYSTGSIGNGTYGSGGITGESLGALSDAGLDCVISITNCYSAGTIFDSSSAAIVYQADTNNANTTVTITNCFGQYAVGVGINSDDIEFVSWIQAGVTINSSSLNNGAGSGTWSGSKLDTSGSVWDTGYTPYLLQAFETTPWDATTYTSANDTSISFAAGDPHITPMIGNKYDLNHIGKFKLFDNNNKNRLIIIGKSDYVKKDYRSKNMSYITTIYVKYNEMKMIIDMGFRGKYAQVLYNDGFDVISNLLKLNDNIKRKCSYDGCKYLTKDRTNNLFHNFGEHYIPDLLRNELKFNLNIQNDNEYIIKIVNVDETNCHPCQIFIDIKDKTKIHGYTGAMVYENDDNIKHYNEYDEF